MKTLLASFIIGLSAAAPSGAAAQLSGRAPSAPTVLVVQGHASYSGDSGGSSESSTAHVPASATEPTLEILTAAAPVATTAPAAGSDVPPSAVADLPASAPTQPVPPTAVPAVPASAPVIAPPPALPSDPELPAAEELPAPPTPSPAIIPTPLDAPSCPMPAAPSELDALVLDPTCSPSGAL